MKILSSIPNLITAANLMCGVFGIKFLMDTFAGGCLESNLNSIKKAACFVIVGAFLDLFDGLLARILKVDSKIGKYLDSLADLITFGVLPSFILYSLSTFGLQMFYAKSLNNFEIIKLGPLLLPIFTAYRLARFNTINDSEYFTGLSSTAVGIFTSLLAIMSGNKNSKVLQGIILDPYIILFLSLFLSLLMVSNVKFFSLKFIKDKKIDP